jgi:RNA polymerase sigma factor for flagellar operon FliA
VPVDSPEILERFHAELDLVEIVARQVIRATASTVDIDDLLSAGREGLLAAARRFDPNQEAAFRTYADYRVRGAMLDEIRKMATLPRRAYARLAALEAASAYSEGDWQTNARAELGEGDAERALDDHLAAMAAATAIAVVVDASRGDSGSKTSIAPGDDPEQAFATAELVARVRREIEHLTEERELTADAREIIQRHYFEGQSISQIARELNIDKSWASRQHSRAIARLAERLREPESVH